MRIRDHGGCTCCQGNHSSGSGSTSAQGAVSPELPGSNDLKHVRGLPQFIGKRREWCRQFNDANRGIIQDLKAGRLQNFYCFEFTSRQDGY
jgi:hypothetical protein